MYENVNNVYGPDTVTLNHVQVWLRRFRYGNFDAKDAPRSGRAIVENIDKFMEIVEADRHISIVSITQGLNIVQKIVFNYINKDATRVNAKNIKTEFLPAIATESQ